MKRYKALLDQRAKLQQEHKAILAKAESEGNRKTTEDERKRLGEIKAERVDLDAEIETEMEAQEWERTKAPVIPTGNEDTEQQAKERKGEEPKAEKFDSFGQMLQAVHRAAVPGGRVDGRLYAGPTGLNEGVGSDGGYFVDTDRNAAILQRTYAQGEIISRVTHLPLGANSNGIKLFGVDETSRADGSRYGGVRSYWTAEGGQKLASQPKFREMDLKLKKLAALVYVTDELLEDSTALEAWINLVLPSELRFRAEDAILSGIGGGQPLGIFNAGSTITVTKDVGQAAATLTYSNVLNMWSRMWAPSRKNAVWLIDQSVEPQLYAMSLVVGVGGVPVYMPAGAITGQPFSTLFGRPIIPVEYLSALGTKGDIVLTDLSEYLMIDKGDVKSASSIHVRFIYDETVFRFVYRVDGQPGWNAPLTPKNGGPTLSPAIVLENR